MQFLEIVKDTGAFASCALGIIALCGVAFKYPRKKLLAFVTKTAKTSETENEVSKLSEKLDRFSTRVFTELTGIREENAGQTSQLNVLACTNQAALGNAIKHIYYTYQADKAFPIYEKEALILLHDAYKSVHGNHFVDTIYGEMMQWNVIA